MIRCLLLAAALAAAPDAAAAPPANDAPAPAAEAAAGAMIHRPPLSTQPTYVQMPPLLVSAHSDFATRGLLLVTFSLDAQDASDAPLVRAMTPRLRHAHNAALLAYTGREFSYGEVPDPARIRELLQQATDATIGAGAATVYLETVQIQDN